MSGATVKAALAAVPAPVWLGVGVGMVALVGIALASSKAAKLAANAAPYVNPVSDKNIAYQGVNEVARIITGRADSEPFSLGAWIWELTHPSAAAAERDLTTPYTINPRERT